MKRRFAFGAALLAGTMVLAGCGSDDSDSDSGGDATSDVVVGLAYDIGGRGDQSFNDAAAAGLDRAVSELGVEVNELEAGEGETDAQREERLRLLASSGNNPVIAVGFDYATAMAAVAPEFPDVSFAIVDSVVEEACTTTGSDELRDCSNVASLVFTEEEGSFLVGAIAAQASESGQIGFVGGVEVPLIQKFEAGYVAGAEEVNPDIEVQVRYLTPAGNNQGFRDPELGRKAAEGMYQSGADVVYHAAGGSGAGVFEAALAAGQLAIGVDSDQYLAADDEVKPVILTSMIKRVDTAVYDMIASVVDEAPLTGVQAFDLEADGVGYSTSNTAVEPYTAVADELAQQIIDGTIEVPSTP